MNNKNLVLFDKNSSKDNAIVRKTDVIAKVHGTDTVLFRKSNKVIVPGSYYTASKHFGITPPVKLPTYNTALGLDNVQALTNSEELGALVLLFAVGTDGCGPESSQVFDVDYTKWIAPESLVPFRYVYADNDLTDTAREKYFGRKAIAGTDKIAYYFKAFEAEPKMFQQYVDGTPIDTNIYISDNNVDVETFVELNLAITKEELFNTSFH